MFWECPVVISLWTHVTWFCHHYWELIGLLTQVYVFLMMILISCISSMQNRLLFAGFTAVKKTIIQNWVYTHTCVERHIGSVASCKSSPVNVQRRESVGPGLQPLRLGRVFLLNIRNYLKEWLLCSCCPSLSPSLLIEPWDVEYVSAVLFCFILDILLCCVWKNK